MAKVRVQIQDLTSDCYCEVYVNKQLFPNALALRDLHVRNPEKSMEARWQSVDHLYYTLQLEYSPRVSAIFRAGSGPVGGYFCFDSIRAWGSAPRTVTELDETDGLPFPAAAAF